MYAQIQANVKAKGTINKLIITNKFSYLFI